MNNIDDTLYLKFEVMDIQVEYYFDYSNFMNIHNQQLLINITNFTQFKTYKLVTKFCLDKHHKLF